MKQENLPPSPRTESYPEKFPRRHKGTQGTGHFTVRPCGPHSLSPSLAFLAFFGKHHPSYLARYRRVCGCRGKWKFRSLDAWKLGFVGGAPPHTPTLFFIIRSQGAKRRAAVAVSGGTAERPMKSEAVRAPSRLCGPHFPGHNCQRVLGENARQAFCYTNSKGDGRDEPHRTGHR